jgi:hypothetical protein
LQEDEGEHLFSLEGKAHDMVPKPMKGRPAHQEIFSPLMKRWFSKGLDTGSTTSGAAARVKIRMTWLREKIRMTWLHEKLAK